MSSRLVRAGSELLDLNLELRALRVCPDSEAAGASLRDLSLPERVAVTAFAVWRGPDVIAELDGETRLQPDDVVVAAGAPDRLDATEALLGGSGCG